MHLVKFAGTLTKEQQRAAKELAKAEKGWYDREQGGFMMRSEESAKQLADTILNNDDAVSDAQPVSLADTRKIVETEQQVQPTNPSGCVLLSKLYLCRRIYSTLCVKDRLTACYGAVQDKKIWRKFFENPAISAGFSIYEIF